MEVFLGILCSLLTGIIFFQWKKNKDTTREINQTLHLSSKITQIILQELNFEKALQKVADTIPNELKFATGVIAIIDESRMVIKRVAASRTKEAQEAIKALSIPFEKIEIPLDDSKNLLSLALANNKFYFTKNFHDVVTPVISQEEAAKIQKIMGTKTTLIYPFLVGDRPIGVFIASTSKEYNKLTQHEIYVIEGFVNLIGLILQNSKLFTSLQATTQKLKVANIQLQQLDQLKDDFVSIASHELRTPMTAIRSYAWMALNRSDIPLSPKLKKYLERTLISTERLINLVNDMLNVSRIESGRIDIKPKALDLQSLVADVLSEIEVKASEKSIKLHAEYLNLPIAFADSDKVHQVLLNLLGNALKFTPRQGTISVSFFSDGKVIETRVADSGVGISSEDLSKLFQKFGRLDNSYIAAATTGGTGLGLYISKSLIDKMGGNIWATSEGLGKGTTFHFSLPVATRELLEDPRYKITKPNAKPLEPVSI